MKTSFENQFYLYGLKPCDQLAYNKFSQIRAKGEKFCEELDVAAALNAYVWPNNYPSTLEELEHYKSTGVIALAKLQLIKIAIKIKVILDQLQADENQQLFPADSELAAAVAAQATDPPILVPTIPSICTPISDDEHICTSILHLESSNNTPVVASTSSSQPYIWSAARGNQLYSFNVFCQMKMKLEQ